MKPLDEMSIGHRIAITMLIVLVILFALALFGYLTGRWDEAEAQDDLADNATLLQLDKQALDVAYREQVQKLFGVWLAHQAGDSSRLVNGLRIARRAYNQAATQLARREQHLQQR